MSPVTLLGIDVGGTKIAAGLVRLPEGTPLHRTTRPTLADRDGGAVLQDVLTVARDLARHAASTGQSIRALGVGVCELVDPSGRIFSSNCLHWEDLPVRDTLSTIAPATIEADVRAAARAEAQLGAGRPFRTFLYVTVGTGISAALVLDGQPFVGARGATGTIASSPLSLDCAVCGATSELTLEQIASGPALVTRYNANASRPARSAEEVTAAACQGDAHALHVVRSAGEALGTTIGLLVNTLDPEAIVIGGGLGLAGGLYWESLEASTRRHIWSESGRGLPILPAATGADAGWIGAAVAAWQTSAKE